MTATITPNALRNWAILRGIPVATKGRISAEIRAQHAAEAAGTSPATTTVVTTQAAVPAATEKLTKLGVGQGQYRRADKLTDRDVYMSTRGKEWLVTGVDIDSNRVVVTMIEDDLTATVKFDAHEMVRVL